MPRCRRTVAVLATAALSVAVAGCGSGGRPTQATSQGAVTVDVEMVDVAYRPNSFSFTKGDTVTFRFTNRGETVHDAYIGDAGSQADHEEQMRSGHDHGHGKGEPAVTVAPGETKTLTHTFRRAGSSQIGCHQPGHYAGGMRADITVR
jgi:uncharacterized cupredoxin-like copper-binding protein